MKFHHFLAAPFLLIAYIFAIIAWQLGGDENQDFINFIDKVWDDET